jgi:hypothetical protein
VDRAIAVRTLFGFRTWSLDVFVYTPDELAYLRRINGTLPSIAKADNDLLAADNNVSAARVP